jgi:signal transduction histidine kinase
MRAAPFGDRPVKQIPRALLWCAAAFAGAWVGAGLLLHGSSLPLAVQLLLALATMGPWIPGIPQRYVTWWFVLLASVPTLVFTWSGGSPIWFAVLALSASRVATFVSLPRSLAFALWAAFVVAGRQLIASHDTNWLVWTSYVELGIALGWAMKSQRLLLLRQRAASREHAQLAALEERRRIARDVHDVLAHTLTILMVHVNSARLLVHDDPEATSEVLDEVATYGRRCLEEIRRTVGLLSENSPNAVEINGPIASAEAIQKLVATYRRAGIDIDLRLDVAMGQIGTLAEAPSAIWHSHYRVVQECVANAVKHASGAPVDLLIEVSDSQLRMKCSNPIVDGEVLELPKGGNGITGMRERVEQLGGSFSAGLESKRWVVRTDQPLTTVVAGTHRESLGWAS